MADLVSANLKEEKMLTRSNWCTSVALSIAPQLVESIREQAEPGIPSSTFSGRQAQTEPWTVIRLDCWRNIGITLKIPIAESRTDGAKLRHRGPLSTVARGWDIVAKSEQL